MSSPNFLKNQIPRIRRRVSSLLFATMTMLASLSSEAEIAFENRAPYIATEAFERTLHVGAAQKVKFYVTDFEHRDYMKDDHSQTFALKVWLDGTLIISKNVNSGLNEVTLPVATSAAAQVRVSLQVEDAEGRKSHVLNQLYRVIDPVTHAITPAQTYTPTALELQTDFGVYNDGTNAETTTTGLTAFLKWARDHDYRKVVIPTGIYLIDENKTVMMASGLTLDMNGSTFKQRPSAKGSTLMMEISHCIDSHVVNGTFEGDLDDHDYSVDSYSEFVNALRIGQGAEYCSFKDIDIIKVTGYGSNTAIDYKGRPIPYGISQIEPKPIGAFTLGEIDEATGTWVASTTRTTHATPIVISDFIASHGFIQLGRYLGYMNNPVDNWIFRASFYDVTGNYVGSEVGHLYRRMYPPTNAHTARFTLYSPIELANNVVQVYNIRAPYNCDFINLHHENIRCVGMVPSGFNNLRVEGCTFTNTGWYAAKAGFDAEDGWDLMQDLTFVNNHFYDNPHTEFIAIGGHNFLIENNTARVSISSRNGSVVLRNNEIGSAHFTFGPISRSAYPRIYNNVIAGRVDIGSNFTAAQMDREHCIRDNEISGGVLVQGDGREGILKTYVYRCDLLGGSLNGRAVKSNLEGITTNLLLPTKWFQIEESTVSDSTLSASQAANPAIIVGSTLTNCRLTTMYATAILVGNELIDTDFLATYWTHSQQLYFEGNTITTSLPFFVQAYNDFTRISLHNNTVNSTHSNFKAVNLVSPSAQSGQPTTMEVMMTGNTFNANGGHALAVGSVPASYVTLTAGFRDNSYNSITEHTSNITGHPTLNLVNPPTVSLTNPLPGTILPTPGSVTLIANASDSDGTIAKVEFYDRHIKVGEATSAPFSLTLSEMPANVHSFTARAIDNDGAVYVSSVIPVSVQDYIPPKTILFVASSAVLNGFDNHLKVRLEAAGHTVITKDDNFLTSADADGKDLILVSDTVNPTLVNTTLRDTSVPVLVWEASLFSAFGMTGPLSGTDYGVNGGTLNVAITGVSHPMTAGLSGSVPLTTTTYAQSWASPSSSAIVIATRPGLPSRAVIFAYESGATMVGLTAPGRRIGFPLQNGGVLSTEGYALFDAAVNWALGL